MAGCPGSHTEVMLLRQGLFQKNTSLPSFTYIMTPIVFRIRTPWPSLQGPQGSCPTLLFHLCPPHVSDTSANLRHGINPQCWGSKHRSESPCLRGRRERSLETEPRERWAGRRVPQSTSEVQIWRYMEEKSSEKLLPGANSPRNISLTRDCGGQRAGVSPVLHGSTLNYVENL